MKENKGNEVVDEGVKSHPRPLDSTVQVLALDPELEDPPSKKISSIVHAPTSSTPSKEVPQHLLGNEDLAWERFSTAVTDVHVGACYNMSSKDFEHSGVHDLFKVSLYIYIYIYISRP